MGLELSGVAILAVNYGSSSLKTALFGATDAADAVAYPPSALARIRIPRLADGRLIVEWDGKREERQVHDDPLAAVADALKETGLPAPVAIGHRFVHGGRYDGPQLLTPDVLAELEQLIPWAPQHEPAALSGVAAATTCWPHVPQVGCFDSAFHRTMPEVAQRLPLPRALWDEGIRRYGFHGLSYTHVVRSIGRRKARPGRRRPSRQRFVDDRDRGRPERGYYDGLHAGRGLVHGKP